MILLKVYAKEMYLKTYFDSFQSDLCGIIEYQTFAAQLLSKHERL